MPSANRLLLLFLVLFSTYSVSTYNAAAFDAAAEPDGLPSSTESLPVLWRHDYHATLALAEDRRTFALLWFYDPTNPTENDRLERDVFSRQEISDSLKNQFTLLKLPTSVAVPSRGEQVVLLDHSAFAEMHHSPGIAVIDLAEPDSPLHRQVVSIYPFTRGPISAEKLAVLLALPRGTLTQRTLIFAVRTHPELPASTAGHFSQVLARETENHATHQARITLQGHHDWNTRFHAINAELPGGLIAREVCAESWPGQNLLEAAEECVHSWRQSSGHWSAVSSRHVLFGYDMKRGRNGIWYATGIFATRM